jgi:uncharacterized protein YfaP (DUF2135 family)
MDLYVITPNRTVIYFGNRIDDASGGQLDVDHIPYSSGLWVENIFFPSDGSAPKGVYGFYVYDRSIVAGSEPESWSLEVSVNRRTVAFYTGISTFLNPTSPTFVYQKN